MEKQPKNNEEIFIEKKEKNFYCSLPIAVSLVILLTLSGIAALWKRGEEQAKNMEKIKKIERMIKLFGRRKKGLKNFLEKLEKLKNYLLGLSEKSDEINDLISQFEEGDFEKRGDFFKQLEEIGQLFEKITKEADGELDNDQKAKIENMQKVIQFLLDNQGKLMNGEEEEGKGEKSDVIADDTLREIVWDLKPTFSFLSEFLKKNEINSSNYRNFLEILLEYLGKNIDMSRKSLRKDIEHIIVRKVIANKVLFHFNNVTKDLEDIKEAQEKVLFSGVQGRAYEDLVKKLDDLGSHLSELDYTCRSPIAALTDVPSFADINQKDKSKLVDHCPELADLNKATSAIFSASVVLSTLKKEGKTDVLFSNQNGGKSVWEQFKDNTQDISDAAKKVKTILDKIIIEDKEFKGDNPELKQSLSELQQATEGMKGLMSKLYSEFGSKYKQTFINEAKRQLMEKKKERDLQLEAKKKELSSLCATFLSHNPERVADKKARIEKTVLEIVKLQNGFQEIQKIVSEFLKVDSANQKEAPYDEQKIKAFLVELEALVLVGDSSLASLVAKDLDSYIRNPEKINSACAEKFRENLNTLRAKLNKIQLRNNKQTPSEKARKIDDLTHTARKLSAKLRFLHERASKNKDPLARQILLVWTLVANLGDIDQQDEFDIEKFKKKFKKKCKEVAKEHSVDPLGIKLAGPSGEEIEQAARGIAKVITGMSPEDAIRSLKAMSASDKILLLKVITPAILQDLCPKKEQKNEKKRGVDHESRKWWKRIPGNQEKPAKTSDEPPPLRRRAPKCRR
ncbi:MAG TPA: hypothetical protein ENI70_01860 [Candidatus Peregrinibacteria bacterium]|nr:hypothetical protein [Candidatus Peregrinibacteria bacterium]